MKYKIALVAFLSISLGYSQNLVPKAVTQEMSQGKQPGITVFIANATKDNIEDAIKEVTKSFKGKEAKIRKSDEFYLDNATIEQISANTIDMHQIITKGDNGYNYTAFFNLGGLFLDNAYDAQKFDYATSIVKNIATKASFYGMDEVIDSENKVLETLEGDKKDMVKNTEKLEKSIEKAKSSIKDSEKEIQENIKLMESKSEDIEKQRQKIITLQKDKKLLE